MKSLDEVIKTLEECMADDAIESEGVYLATDSLYYLKAYKEMIDNFIGVIIQYKEFFKTIIDKAEK